MLGGLCAADGHRGRRDAAKRTELARRLASMKELDHEAAGALAEWLATGHGSDDSTRVDM